MRTRARRVAVSIPGGVKDYTAAAHPVAGADSMIGIIGLIRQQTPLNKMVDALTRQATARPKTSRTKQSTLDNGHASQVAALTFVTQQTYQPRRDLFGASQRSDSSWPKARAIAPSRSSRKTKQAKKARGRRRIECKPGQ